MLLGFAVLIACYERATPVINVQEMDSLFWKRIACAASLYYHFQVSGHNYIKYHLIMSRTNNSTSNETTASSGALERILMPWSAIVMLIMMLVTVVDVVGRYVFSSPLQGGFEITEILLALIIFAGLPVVSQTNTHITVDLLTSHLSHTARRRQQIVCDVVVALLSMGLAYAMAYKTWDLAAQNETTPYLGLPVSPVSAFMCVSCLITAVLVLLRLVRVIRAGDLPPTDSSSLVSPRTR